MKRMNFVRPNVTYLATVLLLLATGSRSELLIGFSPGVEPDSGRALVRSLEDLIRSTSATLQTAVGFGIAEATFLIPSTWKWLTNESLGHPGASQTLSSANLVVSSRSDNAFGSYPVAMQYGPCGTAGTQIQVPSAFLLDESEVLKEKLLAKEWLKYNYGVFDESGFPNDPRYPLFYSIPGGDASDVRVTDCTNVAVEYYYSDNENNNCSLAVNEKTGFPTHSQDVCNIHVNATSEEAVTSSLLYYMDELTKMEHVCGQDDYPHNSLSPNKHNALCGGQSIWKVLQASPNFEKEREAWTVGQTEFLYVQESELRVVAVWDHSDKIGTEKGNLVLNVIRRLLYDLPDGSKFATVKFIGDTVTGSEPVTLSSDRRVVEATIKSHFIQSDRDACTDCAIGKAVQKLLQDDRGKKGFIVIIASSNPKENQDIVSNLQNSQLCLLVIIFKDLEATTEGFRDYLAASSCSALWEISNTTDGITIFNELYSAVETVTKTDSQEQTTTLKSLIVDNIEKSEDLFEITVDPTASKVTLWVMTYVEEMSIRCKRTDGRDIGYSFTHLLSISYYTYAIENVNVMQCSYRGEKGSAFMIQVRQTSKPGHYVDGQVLVHDTTDANGRDEQMPVIIYAKIDFGGRPVVKAKVEVAVLTPGGDEKTFELLDNGLGDPDITKNDGIYSRYFTQFTSKGIYDVTVTVTDDGKADALMNGKPRCCGSQVMAGSSVSTGPFHKTFKSSFTAIGGRPDSGYKPSKILDLRVDDMFIPYNIMLKWTAPGGEADTGKAERYIVNIFTANGDAASSPETNHNAVNETLIPKENGQEETIDIKLEYDMQDNMTYYITIQAVGSDGKTSDASNAIQFYIPIRPITSTPFDMTTISDGLDQQSGDIGSDTIGIIIGVVIVIILIVVIIYLAIYFFVVKPKREKELFARNSERMNTFKAGEDSDEKIDIETINPVDSIPADVIMKHHEQVEEAKRNNRPPPVFTAESLVQSSVNAMDVSNGTVINPDFPNHKHIKRTTLI